MSHLPVDIVIAFFSLVMIYVIAGYCYAVRLTDEQLMASFPAGKDKVSNVVFINTDVFIVVFFLCLSVILVLTEHRGIPVWKPLVATIVVVMVIAAIPAKKWRVGKRFFMPLFKCLGAIKSLLAKVYPDNMTSFQKSNSAVHTPNEMQRKKTMLKEIIQFGKETVKDILTAHVDVVDIDSSTPFSEVLNIVVQNKYSRIPVYSKTKDNIVGILYIKDLLPYLDKPANFHWQSLIRPYLCVPETKKIDNLLHEFQAKKIHLAVVVDEYGGIAGVVTLEDIIEEIVGEINDEFDDDKNQCIKISKNTYIFDAKISVQDFCKTFNIDDTFFEELGEDTNTLASLVIDIIGDVPRKHQVVRYKQFVFEVLSSDERHISKVKVSRY